MWVNISIHTLQQHFSRRACQTDVLPFLVPEVAPTSVQFPMVMDDIHLHIRAAGLTLKAPSGCPPVSGPELVPNQGRPASVEMGNFHLHIRAASFTFEASDGCAAIS